MNNEQTQTFFFDVTAPARSYGSVTVRAASLEEARAMVERMDPASFDWDMTRDDYQAVEIFFDCDKQDLEIDDEDLIDEE